MFMYLVRNKTVANVITIANEGNPRGKFNERREESEFSLSKIPTRICIAVQ